jgi:hypothetical protein
LIAASLRAREYVSSGVGLAIPPTLANVAPGVDAAGLADV